jgi:hypothetical protein
METHANLSRFVWVKIWLDILFPIYNDQNTVRRKETAYQLIDALRDLEKCGCDFFNISFAHLNLSRQLFSHMH